MRNALKNARLASSVFFLLAALGSGCMSSAVSERIRERSQVTREFVHGDDFTRMVAGACVGPRRGTFGDEMTEYQFPGVLTGGDRQLRVQIPSRMDTPVRISETWFKEPPVRRGDFIVMDSYDAHDCVPAAFMAQRFPGFTPEGDVLMLSKPYLLQEFDAWIYVGYLEPGGGVRWERREAEFDLQWLVRSRKEVEALRHRYWYTVPLDIVTSPVQVAFVVMQGIVWVLMDG